MTDCRLNEMVTDLKKRYGFLAKKDRSEKIQRLLEMMADDIRSKS